jgi:hypothetical protein
MVPATGNTSGSSLARWSSKRRMRILGLEGHYGLRGMPERAALIGGKLAVWSEAGAGTEVELRLPARIVYATFPRRTWWSRLLVSKPAARVGGDPS